jgi:hypothetical protein
MFRPARTSRTTRPEPSGLCHTGPFHEVKGAAPAWAYLPDLAETIALLANRERRCRPKPGSTPPVTASPARRWPKPSSTWQGSLPIKPSNWLPIYFPAPFVTLCREVIEMRYLGPTALQLDDAGLVGVPGSEPHTKLDEAGRASIAAPRSPRRPVWPFRTQVIGSSSEPSGQAR